MRFGLLIVFVSCIVLGGIDIVFWSHTFELKDVFIEGLETIKQEEILTFVPKGENILTLSINSLEREIESIPKVRKCNIIRVLPCGLKIRIQERKAIVLAEGSKFFLVDEEGIPFEEIIDTTGIILPRISYNTNFVSLGRDFSFGSEFSSAVRLAILCDSIYLPAKKIECSGCDLILYWNELPVKIRNVPIITDGIENPAKKLNIAFHEVTRNEVKPLGVDIRFRGQIIILMNPTENESKAIVNKNDRNIRKI